MIGLTRLPQLYFALLLAVMAMLASSKPLHAQGFDRVRLRNGSETGKITKMTPLGITLTKGGIDRKVPAEEILSIAFAGEPTELPPARRNISSGQIENALNKLNKIDLNEVERPEVQQEIDFQIAYCKTKLAIAGQGTVDKARQLVSSFLKKNSKSYRIPATIELQGDLLLAKQDYSGARAQYTKLGKAPAPFYKARSALLVGRTLQAEGNHSKAVDSFEQALQAAAGNTVAKSQTRQATLHRAVSQAALGDIDTSTQALKEIIEQADAKDTMLLAQAYNALGDCYQQAQQKKSSVQAYLHVDLLFNAATTEHAKALYKLSQMWDELGQPTRARDAKQRLQNQYPGSQWARK